jgi:hypothetical protein
MNRNTLNKALEAIENDVNFWTYLVTADIRYDSDGPEVAEHRAKLKTAMCVRDELHDLWSVYKDIREICQTVASGSYRDYQLHHPSEDFPYDVHEAIADLLDELEPFSDDAKALLGHDLNPLLPRRSRVELDEDGEERLVFDVTPEEQRAYQEQEQLIWREMTEHHHAHIALMREICGRKGDLQEIISIIEDGLPLQETVQASNTEPEGDRPPQPPSPGNGLVYEWSESLGEYLLVREHQA